MEALEIVAGKNVFLKNSLNNEVCVDRKKRIIKTMFKKNFLFFFFFFFQKLSIYGDSEYIKEQKLIPYPASSLLIITSNGSEEEAGPLPSKVNLGQSNI